MPKKFGLNTKKEEAKARVAETKKSKAESERKAKEDLEWQDHDKLLKAKEDRKKENLEKKIREKERKEENKKIAEQESEVLAKKTKPSTSTKMTRAQIESARLAAIASMQAQIRKEEEDKEKALRVIDKSEKACLISNSINSKVSLNPIVIR